MTKISSLLRAFSINSSFVISPSLSVSMVTHISSIFLLVSALSDSFPDILYSASTVRLVWGCGEDYLCLSSVKNTHTWTLRSWLSLLHQYRTPWRSSPVSPLLWTFWHIWCTSTHRNSKFHCCPHQTLGRDTQQRYYSKVDQTVEVAKLHL